MNFLAHIYLSGDNDKTMVGNFIGDFVKGRQFSQFELGIQDGIHMHREIDRYTDSHEVVHRSKSLLTEKYRHYAGVIVDIFYDHYLAKNWSKYHPEELLPFTKRVYKTLNTYNKILPPRVNEMLKYMIPNNWLYNYSFIEGIQKVLNGMARRTTFESRMELAVVDLEAHYEEFHDDFSQFFPDLINFANSFDKSS